MPQLGCGGRGGAEWSCPWWRAARRSAADRPRRRRSGPARVRIEVLATSTRVAERGGTRVPPSPRDWPGVRYLVQVASLSDSARAEHLRRVLGTRFPDAHVAALETAESRYYRVVIGPYPLRGAAVARGEMVNRLGYPAVIMEDSAP